MLGTRRESAGGKPIEQPPGWRKNALGRLHFAYLRDPDGNKICTLHRGELRRVGCGLEPGQLQRCYQIVGTQLS